jgi:hypothetical protein
MCSSVRVSTKGIHVRMISCNILQVLFQSNKVQDRQGEPHEVLQIRETVGINLRTTKYKT